MAPPISDQDRADAVDLAAAGVVAGDRVRTAIAESYVVERNLYCPAPVPCIGRTGVLAAIPVYLVRTGEKLGEVHMTYCPACGARTALSERS